MTGSARATTALTALLVALVAFGPMSIDIYLPSLPQMTRVFATDVAGAQLTLSVFAATLAMMQLIYGPLSDRFGRRPVLLAGVSIYVVGSLRASPAARPRCSARCKWPWARSPAGSPANCSTAAP